MQHQQPRQPNFAPAHAPGPAPAPDLVETQTPPQPRPPHHHTPPRPTTRRNLLARTPYRPQDHLEHLLQTSPEALRRPAAARLWNPTNSTPRSPPPATTHAQRRRRPSTPPPPNVPLPFPVIDVISATSAKVEVREGDVEGLRRVKMSSTFVRGWIVERMEGERGKRDGEGV